jgi:hypothetical protein
LYIFLDESGDLGLELSKPGTSQHFVITLLLTAMQGVRRGIEKAIERTIRNKIRKGKKGKITTLELKGTNTSLEVKQYFYRQVSELDFTLYTVILPKQHINASWVTEQEQLYNDIAGRILEQLPLETAMDRVMLMLDKRKSQADQRDLNHYLSLRLHERLPRNIPLEIFPVTSDESRGIQAVDLFCWGIYRKYEVNDLTWYRAFNSKIQAETFLFPPKEKEEN